MQNPKVFHFTVIRASKYKLSRSLVPEHAYSLSFIFIFFYFDIVLSSSAKAISKILFSVCRQLMLYYGTVFFIFHCLEEVFFIHPVKIILLRKNYFGGIRRNRSPRKTFWIFFSIGDFYQLLIADIVLKHKSLLLQGVFCILILFLDLSPVLF